MSPRTADTTIASRLAVSPAVDELVQRLVGELTRAQADLTGARPPIAGLRQPYEQALAELESLRGRSALYPYLGSGLGHGPLVELCDGSVKWDLINGIGVHMFGHSEPELAAVAIRAAMSDVVMQGNLQYNDDSRAFTKLLMDAVADDTALRHCFLTNSGAMANESALKICMHHREGRAPRIMTFSGAFLGRSITLTQIGDNAASRVDLPLNTLVDYVPFYDPEHGQRSIEYAAYHVVQYLDRYPGQHACFVMELVQGEGGFNVAPREFFTTLMKICREHNVPVWVDEIQTFGRTEQMFHFQQLGLGEHVDVVTLGKMSQVCACLYTGNMNPRPGLLSGTFIGSTIGLQVGRRALERMRDGGYYGPEGRIAQLHAAFREQAERLVRDHADWFPPVPHYSGLQRIATGYYGGVGGMMRLTPFAGEKTKVQAALHTMFADGLIAFYCGHGPYHIRFLPPVGVMRPEQFDDVFAILEGALAKVAAGD